MALQTITPENLLQQALAFPLTEQRWLAKQLINRLLDNDYFPQNGTSNGNQPETTAIWQDDDEPLPERATLDEAITLYLADRCSLGRAAELAGVTRWDIQDILKERDIPIVIDTDMTAEEMDELAEELESEGLLCSL